MVDRPEPDDLRQKLAVLDAAIAAHPLASAPVTEANAVIDELKPAGQDVVARELAARGLPDLVALGRITIRDSASWWRLHRNRAKLVARIERLSS